MKGVTVAVVAGMLGGALAASSGEAQGRPSLFLAAGPSFPLGDFGDYAKTGWFSYAGFNVPIGDKGLSAGGNVAYGSNKHSDVVGDKTNLMGGFGFLQYRAGNPAKPGVYFYGEVGALNHQFKAAGSSGYGSASEWKLAVGGGAGIDIPAGPVGLFIEASIIARGDTKFVPVVAGLSIPVGKKK